MPATRVVEQAQYPFQGRRVEFDNVPPGWGRRVTLGNLRDREKTMRLDPAVPLSAGEEYALRQVATGVIDGDSRNIKRLVTLGLLQRRPTGPELTPLGHQRFSALPKAALLQADRGNLIDVVLMKYADQFRAQRAAATPRIETRGRPPRAKSRADLLAANRFTASGEMDLSRHFIAQARARMQRSREMLRIQRQIDSRILLDSQVCIQTSVARLCVTASRPGIPALPCFWPR